MIKPIRILHLNDSLNKNSGVMSVIMNYYRNINRDKIQFDFIYFNESNENFKKEIKNMGGNYYKIDRPSLGRTFKNNLRNLFQNINRENKYHTMHVHIIYLSFLFVPIAKKSGFDNIIAHTHNTKYSDHLIGKIRNYLLSKFMNRHHTHFIACSKEAGKFSFKKSRMNKGDVYLLNNAINTKDFEYNQQYNDVIRDKYKLMDKTVIGHVGRFAYQKNHKFIIDIFKEVIKADESYVLFLIGEGKLKIDIENYVRKLNIESNVIITDYKSDVNKYFMAFDIFVLPSRYEGLGIVGVEAQAAGCYTLIADHLPEDLNIINYERVKLSKKEVWIDKILNFKDVDRMSAINYIKDAGYDIKIEAKKLEGYYDDLENKEIEL